MSGRRRKARTRTSERERKFIEFYMASGNGRQAAIRAGYSPTAATQQAARLLTKDHIRRAIDARAAAGPEVAARQERQAFWTAVMRGRVPGRVAMKDRLRASELLGKSQGDFLERIQHEAGNSLAALLGALPLPNTSADPLPDVNPGQR